MIAGPFSSIARRENEPSIRARIIAQWLESHHRGPALPVRNVEFLQANSRRFVSFSRFRIF
jgi:hypothetical protein